LLSFRFLSRRPLTELGIAEFRNADVDASLLQESPRCVAGVANADYGRFVGQALIAALLPSEGT
jgi:hypothetical protein